MTDVERKTCAYNTICSNSFPTCYLDIDHRSGLPGFYVPVNLFFFGGSGRRGAFITMIGVFAIVYRGIRC